MKRNVVPMLVDLALMVAIIILFLNNSRVRHETERLRADLIQTEDSLAMVGHAVDSLKALKPGLGDYMSTIQLHAAKLWFAASASNWKLATYETGELDETMAAAEGLNAVKESVNVSHVLAAVRASQLPALAEAIARKDLSGFRKAYALTLDACNGCHRPAGVEFIHVIPPKGEPVTNQRWEPGGN